MATPTQIAANRANSKHSTGPVSVEGKQASSRNAATHGLTSSQVIVPGEDPAEFEALRSDILFRLAPEGKLEHSLAENVAVTLWRHMRMLRYESAFWRLSTAQQIAADAEAGFPDSDPDVIAASIFMDSAAQPRLSLIHRYLTSAERAYSKALTAFEKAKAARPEPEPVAEPEPEQTSFARTTPVLPPAYLPIQQQPPNPAPTAIGFVSQNSGTAPPKAA